MIRTVTMATVYVSGAGGVIWFLLLTMTMSMCMRCGSSLRTTRYRIPAFRSLHRRLS